MALQSLPGGVWVPPPINGNMTIDAAVFVIDAAGEQAALIFRCPKAGNIDRVDFGVTVSNSPDNGLRASLQGVSATTGLPDGTILGATNNAFVTYAHTVTTGWKSTNFGEVAAVTRGQLVAAVVDIPSFTAGDSVTVSRHASGLTSNFPYAISATNTKQTANLPVFGIHYTDGYAYLTPSLCAADTTAFVQYAVNTGTADEWGLGFQVPYPCKLNMVQVTLGVDAGADFEVLVYGADGTTVLGTLTQDGDVTGAASASPLVFYAGSEITLAKNTTYRVTIRPTTTNLVLMFYYTFQSLALQDTLEGGQAFYMTSQLNQGGTWTDYNAGTFRRPRICLNLSACDDAASAGGLKTHPGMSGGPRG